MDHLFNYDTSPLNPALKIIIPLVFLGVFAIYLYLRRFYKGKLKILLNFLMLFALCAVLAGVFRYFGNGTMFGFTNDYSMKWLQSLAMVAEAAFFVLGGYTLLHLFDEEKP
jgi:hypothetical protein